MRDYGKVAPTFWTGKTGKDIKRRGSEAVIVAMYLMSSPHSNMLGLYYQPKLYLAHETGLGIEGASKGLQGCIEAGFCAFDEASEMVWVYEMACYQIADSLKSADKRCGGVQKEYDALPECPFLPPFFDRYAQAFHMKVKREIPAEILQPSEAPSKPLPSQEQEQEQEQEERAERKPLPMPLVLEPQEPPPVSVVDIPLNDGSAFGVTQHQIDAWRGTFPAVNVVQQLRQMRAWCEANSNRRKTRRGVQAFIVTWLTRSQDNPSPGATQRQQPVDIYGEGA